MRTDAIRQTEQIHAHWRDRTEREAQCRYIYIYIYICDRHHLTRPGRTRTWNNLWPSLSLSLRPCFLHCPQKSDLTFDSEGEKLIANSKSPQFCKLNNRQRERERERERKEKTCMKTRGINLYTLSRNYIHDWWIIGLMMMQTASSSQSHINIHL